MNNPTRSSIKVIGYLMVVISILGFIPLIFIDLFIFVDAFPWMFSFLIYPLPILLLTIYEGGYPLHLPISDFVFFIMSYSVICIYGFLLLISGIYLIKIRKWAIKIAMNLATFNLLFGILLSIVSRFLIMLPIYGVLYGLILWVLRKSAKTRT